MGQLRLGGLGSLAGGHGAEADLFTRVRGVVEVHLGAVDVGLLAVDGDAGIGEDGADGAVAGVALAEVMDREHEFWLLVWFACWENQGGTPSLVT